MGQNTNETLALIQRLIGVAIVVGLFVFLTIKGQEIPEWVQWLLVLSVGTLIVGVENFIEIIKILKNIKITSPSKGSPSLSNDKTDADNEK